MAEQKGKLLTCERCGETAFLKFLGMKPREWQNPEEEYETPPDGWTPAVLFGNRLNLCPSCHAEFKKTIEVFMRNTKEA